MNTRQLAQGLIPTPEYERHHTYHSLRQFPELRRTVNDMQFIQLRSSENSNPQSHSQGLSRVRTMRSTHILDELSKSCVEDINAMSEYRRLLLESRKKLKHTSEGTSSKIMLAPIEKEPELSPSEAADQKLTKISISFDSQSYNSHLAGFSGSKLNKKEFAVHLRRCLNIHLKKSELDALFEKMDADGSMLIDGVEFVRYFFSLGAKARWALQLEMQERRTKEQQEVKAKAEEESKK
jgi:hypothetical protein